MITFPMTPAAAGSSPSGYYGTLADLYREGTNNVNTFSDINSDTPDGLNPVTTQAAMNDADARINSKLRRYVPVPVPTAAADFHLLNSAWINYTVAILYGARGSRDAVDPATGAYNPTMNKAAHWYKTGDRLIEMYIEAALNTLPPGTFQAVDIVRDADAIARPAFPFGW